ncbi:hydantoinase/oxoprolinase family protein [Kineosporia babensis]|uniref:Hydantoinase/oxoprolinase family protein n=1 Tax=Kineosporia babensis TaxID=499548 RepID=A0A9X1N8Q8_9ACTN|nr:hydantoinase/oxoprolinase family protein [Kineosporia babensis]
MSASSLRVGVDVGGTFTDVVLHDEHRRWWVHKLPTSTHDPAEAILAGVLAVIAKAGRQASELGALLHGTTVATNLLIERDGSKVGVVTTEGFADVLHIARKKRPLNFSSYLDVPWQSDPIARRGLREQVRERVDTRTGAVLEPLIEDDVRAAGRRLREQGVESVAVCFLASFANPEHENRARALLEQELPGVFVTTSTECTPLYREYERFNTAAVNAYVGPRTGTYLRNLTEAVAAEGIHAGVRLMSSGGGTISAEVAARQPVQLLMSGPAAGVIAGRRTGQDVGRPNVITLDVGGTSTDIGVVPGGELRYKHLLDTRICGESLMVSMLDVETIGAGGGSIASVKQAGGSSVLSVGPRSAGAYPGPACYGRGGTEPTASDAMAVLGWLRPETFAGGAMTLDLEAAQKAVATLGFADTATAAAGIVTVLVNAMASTTRILSERKGLDPRDYAIVAQGGAGPAFGCAVAEALGADSVLIPAHPGLASAFGLLGSDLRYEVQATVWQRQGEADLTKLAKTLAELENQAHASLDADQVPAELKQIERSADVRYAGQGYELRVPAPDGEVDAAWMGEVAKAFHLRHQQTYGRSFPEQEVQVVNLCVAGVGKVAAHTAPQTAGSKLDLAPALPPGATRHAEAKVETGAAPVAAAAAAQPPTTDQRTPAPATTVNATWWVDGSAVSLPTAVHNRDELEPGDLITGPALVEQMDSTVVVPPGFAGPVHPDGTLELRLSPGPHQTEGKHA